MASDTVLACDSSSSSRRRRWTSKARMEWAGTVLYLRPGSESGGPASTHGRRPASGPVTVDTLAPEDFNESSIPQVYEPIYILYQYVSVCIASDRYRGFFLSTKMYVLAGIRTYLVIYARICLASFGLPDFGAVRPTALRAYRKLSCWPAAY